MAKRRMKIGAGVAVSLLGLLLSACGDSSDSGEQDSNDSPVHLAVAVPLSGGTAVYGEGVKRGAEYAADEINEAGGMDGRQVELSFFDTKCTPTEASTVASDIATQDKYYAVVGDLCSADVPPMLPILDRAGITMASPGASAPSITDLVKGNDYVGWFRTAPTDSDQGSQMVQLATDVLGKTKIALLYASDDYGQGLRDVIDEAIPSGAEMVAEETYTSGQTKDFSAQLTKIAAADPDVLLLAGFYNDTGPAVNQMARSGLDVQVVSSAGATYGDFAGLAGDAAEGTYILGLYDPKADTGEANQEFVAGFNEAYGQDPDFNAVTTYVALQVIKKAIEDGAKQSDLGEKARQVTLEDSPMGEVSFSEYGDVQTSMLAVLQIQDGQPVADPELTAQLMGE